MFLLLQGWFSHQISASSRQTGYMYHEEEGDIQSTQGGSQSDFLSRTLEIPCIHKFSPWTLTCWKGADSDENAFPKCGTLIRSLSVVETFREAHKVAFP